MTREIQLSQGKVAIVDDADYEFLKQWKWSAERSGNKFYASRNEGMRPFRRRLRMHTAIMKTPKGFDTDHINGNGLDNRRSNLRVCSHAENTRNACKRSNNTSGYKGVSWSKQTQKWRAEIRVGRTRKIIGNFSTAESAASAYNEAAKKLHGEFVRTQ